MRNELSNDLCATHPMSGMQIYVIRRDIIPQFYESRRVSFRKVNSPTPKSVFGARMRQARERLGLAQDRLGVLIGIDEHSASARMSRYETGVHEPPLATARRMAEVLKVPVAYLYCVEDDLAEILWQSSQLTEADRQVLITSLRERAKA